MPTSTYVGLANVTLGSAQASISFSSISQSYRDLVLVFSAATSANSNNTMRFNGDGGSNYYGLYMTGNGSTATSGGAGGTFMGTDSSAFTTTTVGATNHIIQVLDYSATDKHKPVLIRANRAGGAVDALAFRWGSTSAVTSIVLQPDNGSYTWSAGSTFALYGIAA